MAYKSRVLPQIWSKAILRLRRRRTDIKKGNVPGLKDRRRFRLFCRRGVEQGTHKLVGESNGIGSSVLVVFVLHLLRNGGSSYHWNTCVSGRHRSKDTEDTRG